MTDWSNCDQRLLDEIEPVTTSLSEIVSTEQIMLVGAQCRDLLSSKFGCDAPRRRTNDTDVAIALENWSQFAKIRVRFEPIGHTGHRFLIGTVPTDVVPFGKIEAPRGISSHPPGLEPMNVHGFTDAYQRADQLPLATGEHIRIPRAEGYAILKTHAWLDRSARNEYKDGPDLALVAYWYSQDMERIYAEENLWALDRHDFELRPAAAALLGLDMRQGLSPDELEVLSARLDSADRDLIAHHFAIGSPNWPASHQELRPIVDALFDQLTS